MTQSVKVKNIEDMQEAMEETFGVIFADTLEDIGYVSRNQDIVKNQILQKLDELQIDTSECECKNEASLFQADFEEMKNLMKTITFACIQKAALLHKYHQD